MRFLKALFALLFFATVAQAQETSAPIVVGWTPPYWSTGMGETMTLNGPDNKVAQGFIVSDNCTTPVVKVYVSSVTGSPSASDAKFAFHADNGGVPNSTAIEEVSASGAPSGGSILTSNAFSGTLSPGFYWLVNRNANGSSGSNHYTLRWLVVGSGVRQKPVGPAAMGVNSYGGAVRTSVTAGNWTNDVRVAPAANIQVRCGGGQVIGFVGSTLIQDTANTAYGTREVGTTCVTRATDPTYRVKGITVNLAYNGTAPDAQYCLRTGSASTPGSATCTQKILAANITNNGDSWYPAYFASPVTIAPSTRFHLTVRADSGGGSSTNRFQIDEMRTETDAQTLASYPFGGCDQTFTTNGTSFSQTQGRLMGFGLILDSTQPFSTSGGSGGGIPASFNRGLN